MPPLLAMRRVAELLQSPLPAFPEPPQLCFDRKFVKMDILLPNISLLTNWHFPTPPHTTPTQTGSWSRSHPLSPGVKQFLFLIAYVNPTRAGKCSAARFGCVFLFIRLLPITDSLPRRNLSSMLFPGEVSHCDLERISSCTRAVVSSRWKAAAVQDGPRSLSAAHKQQPREGTKPCPAAALQPCHPAHCTLKLCYPAALHPAALHLAALPPCSSASCSSATLQLCHPAALHLAALPRCSLASGPPRTLQPGHPAALPPRYPAAVPSCSPATLQPCCHAIRHSCSCAIMPPCSRAIGHDAAVAPRRSIAAS
ncbi:uncharacterized protein LOC128853736 [Cuculus canorus]|uniref:uncharacterized protein LOC128853736 n=1 Tax=Cuculus canorus TaxID=55661 RepID=UPI0023AB1BB0|nr:uncharacterized protein LOC128853736 [Cuculus canorus]